MAPRLSPSASDSAPRVRAELLRQAYTDLPAGMVAMASCYAAFPIAMSRSFHRSRSSSLQLALTANARAEDRACLAAGIDDFVTKPIRSEILRECLARWLTPVS